MTPSDPVRPVILHAHLFKNAGTTLDWSLKRSFASCFCDHRDDEPMRGSPSYLIEYLQDCHDLAALSSHWLPVHEIATWAPRWREAQIRPCFLALLRDPVERIASVYEFERRQEVEHPGTHKARTSSLRDYVAWRLGPGTGPVIRNYQTRMLSGIFPGDGDLPQLARARQNLADFSAVGLVERYAQSMVLFEAALGGDFPDLDLSFRSQNVRDASDSRNPAERRAAVESALGDILEEVLAANQLDLALHESVQQEFDRRWQALPSADARLQGLQRRCESLGPS